MCALRVLQSALASVSCSVPGMDWNHKRCLTQRSQSRGKRVSAESEPENAVWTLRMTRLRATTCVQETGRMVVVYTSRLGHQLFASENWKKETLLVIASAPEEHC